MDAHMSFDKEKMFENSDENKKEEKKEERFVWSYVLRPERKGFK